MKKISAILLALLIGAALVACTETKNDNGDDKATVYETVDLAAVADSLYEGIEETPMGLMSMPLTEDDFEFYAFVPFEEGFEAVANESMVGSIAHSVVLVKCPTAEKAQELAAAMKENCNPRKWVCVEADIVTSVTNGNIAMLLMTTKSSGMSEKILENFSALDAEKISSLKSSDSTDDMGLIDDSFIDGEVSAEGENIVYEYNVENVDDVPAAMPEDGAAIDAMPAL